MVIGWRLRDWGRVRSGVFGRYCYCCRCVRLAVGGGEIAQM